MTNEQKSKIIELHRNGMSYGQIANELAISRNTVASFCKRYDVGETLTKQVSFCKCCGSEIEHQPKKKNKTFCSDSCRMKWWNSHKDLVHKKAYYTLKCKYCGKEFTSYGNKDRKFCSVECYRYSQIKGGGSNE